MCLVSVHPWILVKKNPDLSVWSHIFALTSKADVPPLKSASGSAWTHLYILMNSYGTVTMTVCLKQSNSSSSKFKVIIKFQKQIACIFSMWTLKRLFSKLMFPVSVFLSYNCIFCSKYKNGNLSHKWKLFLYFSPQQTQLFLLFMVFLYSCYNSSLL